jgi:hypothetical protein
MLLLTLTAFMMVACEEDMPTRKLDNGVEIITMDSCEYIVAYPYYKTYHHKGNCRFCAERRKQELKELVEHLKDKQP